MSRTVLIVAGFAGSGKTEVSKLLSRELGWALLDKDTLTRPFTDHLLELTGGHAHDRESQFYLDTVRPLEYAVLRDAAEDNARCGISCVLAAPYLREVRDPSWRSQAALRWTALGATLRVVWVRCDVETMRDQLARRGARRDDYKLNHWDAYVNEIELSREADPVDLVFDNSSPRDFSLAELVEDLAVNFR